MGSWRTLCLLASLTSLVLGKEAVKGIERRAFALNYISSSFSFILK